MDIGVFQLLPRGRAATDREVVEQALWEVDFAERHGFESVWVTEHHFSGYGSIGVPSVYAAGIAQRTRRIRIGYAVAVVPLHHPLRLAEEISWVDHLSEGRVAVGVGPGFSAFEFGGFGVPVNERHARFAEGFEVVRRALAGRSPVRGQAAQIHPRPHAPAPPFYWAQHPTSRCAKRARKGCRFCSDRSRSQRSRNVSSAIARSARRRACRTTIDREIGEMYVLRRIYVAETDAAALRAVQDRCDGITRWRPASTSGERRSMRCRRSPTTTR
jgi:alkanesulfonate monooxygenase SsuD/methylene tetrahydromethanopterin reductase-like flavin-dependent oxidoreductase (luciferase family)